MADLKHTAGEWRVGYDDGSGPEYIVDNVTERAVATIRWGCSCCKSDKPLTLFEINRARLIASAPDLLAALEKIVTEAGTEKRYAEDDPWAVVTRMTIENARALIERVKGGAA